VRVTDRTKLSEVMNREMFDSDRFVSALFGE